MGVVLVLEWEWRGKDAVGGLHLPELMVWEGDRGAFIRSLATYGILLSYSSDGGVGKWLRDLRREGEPSQ